MSDFETWWEKVSMDDETTKEHAKEYHSLAIQPYSEKIKDLEKKLAEAELMRDINASQRDACMKMVLVAKEALEKINKEKTPDHINDICDEALKQLAEQ